jgi:plastocyanin
LLSTFSLTLVLVALVASPTAGAATEIVVIDGNAQPLENVVITAKGEPRPTPAEPVVVSIEQQGQQFSPRVTVVAPGTSIRFPNRDLTQHHVYSFSTAKTFEIELYGGDEPAPIPFDVAGIVALGCNIHDWMLGYVYVTPDAIFGTTDASGHVVLDHAFATDDPITFWHPALGNGTPLTTTFGELETNGSGQVQVALDTLADHPIFREKDPLQSLFGDRR